MNVYLYLLDTLADWEIGFITAELNSGRYLDKTKESVSLIKIGSTMDPIKTMGGIQATPDQCIDDITLNDGDVLILPGADTWADAKQTKLIELIQKNIDQQIVIAAICGATMALANAGLLNNRNHTSNDKDVLKMFCPDYTGEKHYLNQPVVIDDHLITASGLAPLEFSYEVLKKINVMKAETLEAWYQLYKTREAEHFHRLMASLK